MRFHPERAPAFVAGLLLTATVFAADQPASADNYANDPYWYKPGHPSAPAEATGIKAPPGFAVDRVLTVPREMGSWISLCVDPAGRLIAAAQQQPGLFRITLPPLDQPNATAQIEKLGGAAATIGWAHGLLCAFDSLYVTIAEENGQRDRGVYRLEDTNGDGQYDRSNLLFKLDGAGEHGPHNLVVTPDGKSLLLMCGNGTKVPADIVARRPATTPGPDHLMPPGFESSHYSTQGWALKFHPDGSDRELIFSGLRNSFDLAFDQSGELFTFDSDAEWDLGTPWYRPTRICHLVPAGEYGWRDDAAVWPAYFEDSVAPVLNIGPGSPSGLIFGFGAKFPARYQRALFVCDWTFATVHAVFLQPQGATYRAEIAEFVGGAGLPLTEVVIGKDGAMYLLVGGRRLGSAIYRVRYTGSENVDAVAAPHPRAEIIHRHNLEDAQLRSDPDVVNKIWSDLGSADRALRFAARVALEKQPVERWRERALHEQNLEIGLASALALARQGTADDQTAVLRTVDSWPWPRLSAEQKLRALRVAELVLARSGEPTKQDRANWHSILSAPFPDADSRVSRELSRLRCALGDTTIIQPLLTLMNADTGETQAMGTAYFERNSKYGQAVREMLESAPLLERMHHAQMLLWLTNEWTADQRRAYFQSLADAVAFSKGGHRYAEFWHRIRDAALERMPAAERPALAAIGAASAFTPAGENVPPPKGPGREWTVASAATLASGHLSHRDFKQGKAMFSAAGCVACHRLGADGGTIGPDLTAVGQRFSVPELLESIVEPSRTISDQYRMVLFRTKEGQTYSGRVLSRDADATRVATNLMRPSQTIAIPNNHIVSEEALPVSVMPSGLVDLLNEAELLDLLAYLVSAGNPQHPAFSAAQSP
ncbi:MAG: c-type cytochrome [Opitutus sp.]